MTYFKELSQHVTYK